MKKVYEEILDIIYYSHTLKLSFQLNWMRFHPNDRAENQQSLASLLCVLSVFVLSKE